MRLAWLFSWILIPPLFAEPGSSGRVVLENPHFRYTISESGKNIAFEDRGSKTNFLQSAPASTCASVWIRRKEFPVTAASLSNGRLTLRFGKSGVQATLKP